MHDKPILNSRDVLAMLGITLQTLQRHIEQGKFPAPLPREHCRQPMKWHRATVDAWLEQQKAEA